MKFGFKIEKNKDEELNVKQIVFNGNLEFMLQCFLVLANVISDNGDIEIKDIIELLEGWEEHQNGFEC